MDSARALPDESPTLPTDASIPASARHSVYFIGTYDCPVTVVNETTSINRVMFVQSLFQSIQNASEGSASGGDHTKPEKTLGGTYSTTSKCSIIRNVNTLEAGCCRPSSSRNSKSGSSKASRKLGAIQWYRCALFDISVENSTDWE